MEGLNANTDGEQGSPRSETPVSKSNSPNPSGPKRIRLTHPSVLPRPLGAAYDAEASDAEDDPWIEEDFLLRVPQGDDCDYLHRAIDEHIVPDISITPLTKDGRRTIVTIRGKPNAAALVYLPRNVEGLKSWDKKTFYKSADISQMMLVLGPIQSMEEAMDYPLPDTVEVVDETTFLFKDGITQPMANAVNYRMVYREVKKLLAEDAKAIGPPRFELIDMPPSFSEPASPSQTSTTDSNLNELLEELEDALRNGK